MWRRCFFFPPTIDHLSPLPLLRPSCFLPTPTLKPSLPRHTPFLPLKLKNAVVGGAFVELLFSSADGAPHLPFSHFSFSLTLSSFFSLQKWHQNYHSCFGFRWDLFLLVRFDEGEELLEEALEEVEVKVEP
ncbi:hypothetical protein VIGAN_07211500 [Vigna angularis var. angularis]|uniref:Uncharacterized protein n=1 Tax=Vigna angularis var. angularis TaxID=157739 RepID=A0A0S3SK29_PHAAN|nr:hypothetical protein VIGAN_07211500 [Vigna angularis var. angularis]